MSQEVIPIDLGGVYSYLLKENDMFLLVDTGGPMMLDKTYTNRCDLLMENLELNGCTKETLKLVVLTHGDSDHCANAAFLADQYKIPIALHIEDRDMVEHLTLDICLRSFNYRQTAMKVTAKLIHKLIVKVCTSVVNQFEAFTPDILLSDHDSLLPYGFHAEILHLPGHTPGSIGIYTQDHDLICGDTFANNKKPAPAPNAWNFEQLYESIQRLKELPIRHYYPGHGTMFSLSPIK